MARMLERMHELKEREEEDFGPKGRNVQPHSQGAHMTEGFAHGGIGRVRCFCHHCHQKVPSMRTTRILRLLSLQFWQLGR